MQITMINHSVSTNNSFAEVDDEKEFDIEHGVPVEKKRSNGNDSSEQESTVDASSTTSKRQISADSDMFNENGVVVLDEGTQEASSATSPLSKEENKQEENEKKKDVKMSGVFESKEYYFAVIAGLFLSLNAGYINGACLSGMLTASHARQSVAGFTGAYTVSALRIADGEVDTFGHLVSMILSFMFGAFVAGFMTPRPKPYRIAPTYGPSFFIGAVFLLISSLLAATQGTDHETKYFFYFAAAANGVQNGVSSSYSANLIRTTHLTGTSTDIGLILGQIVRGNRANLWKLYILVGLALAFWLGGLISFYVTRKFTSYSLLFNAGLFFAIAISLVIFLVKTLNVTISQALFGTWRWQQALEKLNLVTDADGKPVSEEFLMEVFDRIDADGNGLLEEEELLAALKEAGLHNVSMTNIKEMIDFADENDDGLISKDEWITLVRNGGKSSRKLHRERLFDDD